MGRVILRMSPTVSIVSPYACSVPRLQLPNRTRVSACVSVGVVGGCVGGLCVVCSRPIWFGRLSTYLSVFYDVFGAVYILCTFFSVHVLRATRELSAGIAREGVRTWACIRAYFCCTSSASSLCLRKVRRQTEISNALGSAEPVAANHVAWTTLVNTFRSLERTQASVSRRGTE